MAKRIRAKRLSIEISDEIYDEVHRNAKELNMTIRAYIWRLILPDIIQRKRLREEDHGKWIEENGLFKEKKGLTY